MRSVLAGVFAAAVIICAQPAAAAPIVVDPDGLTLDAAGGPIAALNVQLDDLDPLEPANYEISGPLALSDVSFVPAEAAILPEPSVLALIALAVVAVIAMQVRRLRRPRSVRLH